MTLNRLRCLLGRHRPEDFLIRRGRAGDIQEGTVPATLEHRCAHCWVEIPR